MSDASQGYGWWQAADGKWYPPEARPNWPATPTLGPQPVPAPRFSAQPGPVGVPTPGPTARKPLWRRWWFIAGSVVIVLAVVGAIAGPPAEEDASATPTSPADAVGPVDASTTVPDIVASSTSAAGADPSTTVAPSTVPPTTVPPTTVPPTTVPGLTPAQQNAVRSAESYLRFMAFSRQGLIDQLSSEFGDQYSVEDATIAVDSLDVDWNEQAVRSAESYLELMGFSCAGLIDQLSSEFGDQFTLEQATYGATQVGIC